MSERAALAVSIGILASIAGIVFPLIGLQFWVGFVAWAWCLQTGGDGPGLRKTVASLIWGAVLGGAALMIAILLREAIGPWMIRAILGVGLTVIVLVMSSSVPLLSLLPAGICGYATVLGYVLQTEELRTTDSLLHLGRSNGLIAVVLAFILGAVFGVGSQKLTAVLKKS